MVVAPAMVPLFVPADRPERFAKAASCGADMIIIDLEDAVAPTAKIAARQALRAPGAIPAAIAVLIRVNARQTPWFADDLAAIASLGLAGIMLPKAESAEDIAAVAQLAPNLRVTALIETARGLAAARRIAAAPGVARLAFGSIDFCADLGLAHEREALLFARGEIVLAARLAGLPPPVDGVTTAVDDAAAIEADARHARALGFGGKLCIHPKQVAPALRGFAPSAAEIAWAGKILALGEGGASAMDGKMVDAPVRAQAQDILARAAMSAADH